MESRIKVFGHALHPMLVMFPVGLLMTGTFFDYAGLVSSYENWHQSAFLMIGVGTVAGVVSAVPSIVDWLAIPMRTRAKAIGLWHGVGNIAMLSLFGIAWLMRQGGDTVSNPGWMPVVLQTIAVGLGGITAWLGGELVERLGIGVDNGANVNAPSSLSNLPASAPDPETGKTGPSVRGQEATS